MPPVSSLVFVVILAVWAVYLVQHWVRRRDHLATARSVDRFSEAMRVLERRRSLPAPDADTLPRSYATSPLRPARPARPEVVVKRAVPQLHGATAVAPSRDHRRSRRVAQLRAGGLLAGSVTMIVLVALAIGDVLPRWTALVGVGACAVAFGFVRWSVARQRASWRQARGAAPARRAPASRAAAQTAPERHAPARHAPARHAPVQHAPVRHAGAGSQHAHRAVGHHAPSRHAAAGERHRAHEGHEFSAQSVAATLRTAPRRERVTEQAGPELYDIHAVEASLSGAAPVVERSSAAPADADRGAGARAGSSSVADAAVADRTTTAPAGDTWEPVPVPPPTYTLKAKAPRPAPTGSSTLPADGTDMALDEEFEDLPSVHRVG